jgi:alpha-mannosidase
MDLSSSDYGVSLLNRSKYGCDLKGNVMRLSLLRSPKWPDPTADRGEHVIEYSLYPHKGPWRESRTVEQGYEYNYPLLIELLPEHAGPERKAARSTAAKAGREGKPGGLPTSHSFIRLSPSNLVLTTVKKAEDSDAWIFQWYEAKGIESEAELTLPFPADRVLLSDAMEGDGPPLPFEKNTLRYLTKKNGLVTLKVTFKSQGF